MAGVVLESVSKRYRGDVPALTALDLEVRDGEFLVLVGASGSGKSTALRIIAGLETPTVGRVRIGDRDVTDVPARERDVAMVFQDYALYPHMTVRENLAFGLEMRGVGRKERRRMVDAVAERLDLTSLLDRKPAALSGGQRQRVALGRAIVREPAVFLFDEPLSNLDARLRVHTRAELVRLHRLLGTTVVYVTHDQVEAMTMGQRIAMLHAGALQQVDTPLGLYDRPANRIVAGFIGSPPMNFFHGTLRPNGQLGRFVGQSFEIDVPTRTGAASAVVLGVRPEHIRLTATAPLDGIAARAVVLEPLGSETLIHCRTAAGEDTVVRTADRPDLRPEQEVALEIDLTRLHLFDADTGLRWNEAADGCRT